MNPMWTMMPMWTPFLPTDCNKPPTIYSLLQSIVNYGNDEHVKTSNLAKYGRATFFDFDYPLSNVVSKEDFECMILNHYMMRRIGYETFTGFQIALNVKLNEIMPKYNLLFDAINDWSLFGDGERITRNVADSRNTQNTTTGSATSSLNSTTTDSGTTDSRSSNMPNNQIENVQNGSYLSDYNYDVNTSTASSQSGGNQSSNENRTTSDAGYLTETILRSSDGSKNIDILLKVTKDMQNIYTMIFKELDVLFYQLG